MRYRTTIQGIGGLLLIALLCALLEQPQHRTLRRLENPTSSSLWVMMSDGLTSAPTIEASCPERRRTSISWRRRA